MIKILKSVKTVFLALFIIVLFFAVVGYFYLLSILPDYSGEVRLSGIKYAVEINRNNFAVPFIKAENDEDAAFALGFVHAQERMFQMDIIRRAGQGRLSEIFGKSTLKFDKLFRSMQLEKIVKQSFTQLPDSAQKILLAYAHGVNTYIKNEPDKIGIEFALLNYEPESWKPEHSLLIAKLMAWELNISWWTDIVFTKLVKKYGEQKAREILPYYKENAPTIIPKNLTQLDIGEFDLYKTDIEFRQFMGYAANHYGSNNWALSGSKTISGKPIIANDPHLVFSIPGKWFVVSINSPHWKVSGFSLPGVPGIVIGKNENISWVLTNVMADDCDFYIEKLDVKKKKYFLNNNWKDLSAVSDTIFIKDEQPIIKTTFFTHRGPIVSDIHDFIVNQRQHSYISMRWTALEFNNEFKAIINVNKAKTWNDFRKALVDFSTPGQNFVYADVKGNIGYICAAKLPIRSENSATFINDGTTSQNDWLGFVDYEKMPKLFNPNRGYIASANNKTDPKFNYHISNIWEPSSRIERIEALINSKNKLDTSFCFKIQNDFSSVYAQKMTGFLLKAFENFKIKDRNLKTALRLFKNWDFNLSSKSQTAAIYSYYYINLLKNIFYDEMGKELFDEYIFIANVPYRVVESMLLDGTSSWFDNVKTKKIETRDDIIRKSLVDALEQLEKSNGKDVANWQWGNFHSITFKHIFSFGSKFLAKIFNRGPYEIGGDGTSVFNTEYTFSSPFDVKLGPSMRYVYDFQNPHQFYFILPNGQSGHFMSKHYDDMTDKWLRGKYLQLNESIEQDEAYEKLILKPTVMVK